MHSWPLDQVWEEFGDHPTIDNFTIHREGWQLKMQPGMEYIYYSPLEAWSSDISNLTFSVFVSNDAWNQLSSDIREGLKTDLSRHTAWKMHILEFRKIPGGVIFLGLWYYTLKEAYPGLQRCVYLYHVRIVKTYIYVQINA